jgi:hypothetical protein
VEVVEDQHERLGRRELLEQLAHCAVNSVALVQRRRGPAPRLGERGQHLSELRPHERVESLEAAWVEPGRVLVKGVDEDPERQVALILGPGAGEHDVPARVRAPRELRQQAALADPGGADDLDGRGHAALRACKRGVECHELRASADECRSGEQSPSG